MITGEKGGIWTEETHKLLPPNFNRGLTEYIAKLTTPKKMLEFGSGMGYMAKYFNDNCTDEPVHCIEPSDFVGEYNSVTGPILYNLNIFTDSIPQEIENSTYDLVLSIEVAEHIDLKLHPYLFDWLVGKANKWVVFSAGHPGQLGRGHIACRPEEEWRKEFTSRGMIFLPEETKLAKESCDEKNGNHRKNVQIFRKV